MSMPEFYVLFDAGSVARYHTLSIRPQTLAEHSWGVAMIAHKISPEGASSRLLLACLHHDLAEKYTGDVPANVKWSHPSLCKELEAIEKKFQEDYGYQEILDGLSSQELAILKWADTFELCLYCVQQALQGNREAALVQNRGVNYLVNTLGFPTLKAKMLFYDHFTQDPQTAANDARPLNS